MCSGEGYRGEVGREDSGMVFRGNACVSKDWGKGLSKGSHMTTM